MKLLIATHNKAKKDEILKGLKTLIKEEVQIVDLDELHISKEPEETGETFQENARMKAKFYANLSQLPTIADDGGLVIPFLNNEPGVKSRRWPGYEATDEELIHYALLHLKGVIGTDRTAYLETCLCFYVPSFHPQGGLAHSAHPAGEIIFCEQEKIKGRIAEKPIQMATHGYPFRVLFIVEKYNKFYDELTREEHEKENHRLKALKRLVKRIQKYLVE